jgi:polysaccharide biosynthesis protein PslJ
MLRTTRPADGALDIVPALHRSGGADAVTLLTVLVALRLALPSQLVIGALGGAGGPATLVGLLLLGYWFWHRLHRREPERAAAVNVAVFVFVAVVLASYAIASTRPIAADELNISTLSLVSLGGWMGGLLLASDGVGSSARLRVLVARLAALGGAFAGFGLVQFVTATAWVDKLTIPGLVVNTPVYSITQRDGFSRPFSTAIHPIEFGSVIAMLLPLTIVVGLLGSSRGGARWRSWIPALLTVLAASLSSSRSTLVGVALGVVLLWPALTGLQRLLGGAAAVVLGVFVFVTVPGMVGTISGLFGGVASEDSSVTSRLDSFAVAGGYFGRAPLLGRGFGTFLPRYRIFDNQYLLGLVEIGVLGLMAMVLLWVVPVAALVRVLRKSPPSTPQRLIGAGLLASCVVGGVELAFFDGFGFPMMPAIWFVLLGLGGAYVRLARATSS